MPGRNKSELVPEIAKRRPRQPFNKGLAVVALGNFSGDEQMPWSTESISNGACRMIWTVSAYKPDHVAEWRLTISGGEMSTSERGSRFRSGHAVGSATERMGGGKRSVNCFKVVSAGPAIV
jgi:hypothetical protein